MPNSFNVGDTVQLNSGGPVMTVERVEQVEGIDYATCVWFDDKKEVERQTFATAILEKS